MNFTDLIFRKKTKIYFLVVLVVFLTSLFSLLPQIKAREFSCNDYGDEKLTTEELDQIISVCDQEIKEQKKKLKEKQVATTGVKYEIKNLDSKIKIMQSYINARIAKANKLNKSISKNKEDINSLGNELKTALKSLETLIKLKHRSNNFTSIETLFSVGSISDFFSNLEAIKVLQVGISKEVKKISKEKKSLEDLSIELEERESAERELAQEKLIESKKIKELKEYKKDLLKILKSQEGGVIAVIKDKEKTKQLILKKKYRLASGEKISFGDALNLLEPYQSKFKMDTAFVLAILFQESGWGGKIGGNVGRCTYKQKNPCGSNQVMSKSQQSNFEKIISGLGGDVNKQVVSCPICKDGSYGGAMGPAQFMPNTWMGIRKPAAKILGVSVNSLSPFVNQDAFIASAAYLKQQYYSKSCSEYANKYSHISSKKTLRERCAAAHYYAGGNWWKYRLTYGEAVVKRANKFRRDIAILRQ